MQLFSDNGKLDYITVESEMYTHKQIERRNGIIFISNNFKIKSGQLSQAPAHKCSTTGNGGLLNFRVRDGIG